jgi:hypothetical protein
MAKTANTKKERGKFLTIMLILFTFQAIQGLYSISSGMRGLTFLGLIPWGIVALMVLEIAILIGIFYWKRVAIYGFIIYNIAVLLTCSYLLVLLQSFSQSISYLIPSMPVMINATVAPFLLLFWAIRRKWKYFE